MTSVATRSPVELLPDASHVLGQLFVPGHALTGESEGRTSNGIAHVLGLSDVDVAAAVDEIVERFSARHRDLGAMFDRHAAPPHQPTSRRRRAHRAAPAAARSHVHAGVRGRGGRRLQPERRAGTRSGWAGAR